MLTTTQITALEALGWAFLPYAPNEWQWMKFDPQSGKRIADQCDATWQADLRSIRAA
jgi:hypothetical protein